MGDQKPPGDRRKADPYMDRRILEDRRKAYDIGYFSDSGPERRKGRDRRRRDERRTGCIKVSRWSSVCVDNETKTDRMQG